MKITIAGAGSVGFHLAELLSKENQDITLIDINENVLEQATKSLDVMTVQGDASSMQILEQLNLKKTNLFIAVTASEHSNLLAAILAKKLGAKNTVARIENTENLGEQYKEAYFDLGVDVLISPQKLAALEIERLLKRASFTDMFEFEKGKISVVGYTLDNACPFLNRTIGEVNGQPKDFQFKGIALLRKNETIIPDHDTVLRKGDHLYIATENDSLESVMRFVGKQLQPVKRVMIVGCTPLALKTAKAIEQDYEVTLVIQNEEKAKSFLENLEATLVIHADPDDIDTLKSEGLENVDAFIALTDNSETNIIASLMAEELGVYKTIALVENVNYIRISQNIGIDTIINKKLIAANNIFRFVRKGKVEAIASLHGVDAEIIEFAVHKNNRLVRHPVSKLGLPKKSILAGVVRGDRSVVPSGDFTFELNDKVIILALPEAIHAVEEIFK